MSFHKLPAIETLSCPETKLGAPGAQSWPSGVSDTLWSQVITHGVLWLLGGLTPVSSLYDSIETTFTQLRAPVLALHGYGLRAVEGCSTNIDMIAFLLLYEALLKEGNSQEGSA